MWFFWFEIDDFKFYEKIVLRIVLLLVYYYIVDYLVDG